MFRTLRLKKQPDKIVPADGILTAERLARDSDLPISLRQINDLPENLKRRVYRGLLPPGLLTRFGIDPITWKGSDQVQLVRLKAEPGTSAAGITARRSPDFLEDFITLEIADNAYNGVDLQFLALNDPDGPRFQTDNDPEGQPNLFGTFRRNLAEEARAKEAGLAPAQQRPSLGASRLVLDQLEIFLSALGHRAYFLEPLTYASAWVFERRGFAYVRGHKLMDDIHKEFQPGGRLHAQLNGGNAFRQPDQWNTVRGRAWAIHDGILEAIDAHWDGLRMVKQLGRYAGVETFPKGKY